MKLHFYKQSIIILALLFLSACMTNLSPIEVSEHFWTAIKNNQPNEVRKYISEKTVSEDDLTGNILSVEEVSFGRTIIDGEDAWVETTVIVAADESFTLPMKTVLLMEEKQWKINYDETVKSITKGSRIARVIGDIANLSGKLTEELDRSLDDIQKALPEIQREIESIEESFDKAFPEIRRKVEEIIKQLEETFKGIEHRQVNPEPREI